MSAERARTSPPRQLFGYAIVRYAFVGALVVAAFGLSKLLEPVTGTGAPFVLFFGVVLACSLLVGHRAAILAAVLSVPLAAYAFIARAGYSWSQAAFQAALFLVDCAILIYLSAIVSRARRASESSEARARLAAAHFREIIELAPDAIFVADPAGRYTEVNHALCRMLGYEHDELIGKTIFEMIPADDAPRQAATVKSLAAGQGSTSEWRLRKKDGTFAPVELSANIRSDGRIQGVVRDITERQRADEERRRVAHEIEAANAQLRESEERFRLTIDEAPIGMALVAAGGRFARVNRVLCEIVGYERDELERLTFHDITHPDDLANDLELLGQLERGAIPRYQLEKRYIRKDGSIVTIMLSASVLRASDQTPLYYIAQIEDITERKRAEEAVRTSEREFRSLAESMPQIVWTTTADGLNTYVNQQWVDYTGLSLDASSGEGWILPFHPDDRQRAWDAWRRATKYRGNYSVECRMRRADGVYRWWLIRGVPVRGTDGEIEKWFGTSTDIDDIKVAEQRLARLEQEQRFLAEAGALLARSLDYEQTLVSVAQLVVRDFADWCMVDIVEGQQIRRLKVASANPSHADVCAALERIPIDRDRPYLLRPVIEERRALLIEHVSTEQLEAVAQGPAHLEGLRTVNPMSVMGLPLLRSGQLLGALAFISSAPEHRYEPGDLRLAQALAERAAVAIENARLFKASVEAAEVRDQVLGFVAHDLRNPLNIIMIQADLLRRRGGEPERRARQPGERIERAAARMNRLIQDILDVSRMEGGHLFVDQLPVPADQILFDSIEAQKHLAAATSIELELAPGMLVPDVWADRDRILQVFENLIGNAIKFTNPGGRITLGAAMHGRDVVFWVKDTGPGIAPDEMPHVFDRFWQAKKTGRAGAGLGLQIVKGIVEAHGGHIWVESTLGVGTTVCFTLPAVLAAESYPRADLH